MRLWHEKLIPSLPRQQLLGQHRECCALRGNGWGKKHSTVSYVFKYAPIQLIKYHLTVIGEIMKRGYRVEDKWLDIYYRGCKCEKHTSESIREGVYLNWLEGYREYPEHNDKYLSECLQNLKEKGIFIREGNPTVDLNTMTHSWEEIDGEVRKVVIFEGNRYALYILGKCSNKRKLWKIVQEGLG